jgi:ribosomal protein S18 acetylase RimI-like enzyme
VRQQTLRFGDSWARIAPWRGGGDTAHIVVGPGAGVSTTVVHGCVERARACGYEAMLTSAVGVAESDVFVEAGFSVRERLHLLELRLRAAPAAPGLPLERASRRDRDAVLAVDDLSFDPFWRLGAGGLQDALTATPVTRYRVGRSDRRVVAYAITGLAGTHGYLQRVAVHPDERRAGWGRAVVADGLGWLWRHGADHVYVNTQIRNRHAVALYESFGFERLPTGLCVLGRPL